MKFRTPTGEEVDAEDLDFETKKEDWNEYKLSDGTILKVKLVMNKVVRVDRYNPQTGEPDYQIQAKPITRVVVPDKLRKFPKPTNTVEDEVVKGYG